ncbi:MAG: ABC transporter ATP-binding protein [Akkermansiaceae bacterium]|jgi:ABC-2 type transport system ATP-binding protein|nr:ABC transporter ATP-binding protein [Luteolibacter sp.]
MSTLSWVDPSSSSPSDLVKIRDLGVDYGDRRALDSVNLNVPAGEVFGLLGPNGAGKTTMFRVLATLLSPTSGEVELSGIKLGRNPREIRSLITYMPDLAPLPSDLRAVEYLRFYAGAYGLRGKEMASRVDECLDAMNMSDRRNTICSQLSLGMRQRLSIAKAILHRPRLLILDEPASGLDPLARIELRRALQKQAEDGATVIVSSHVIAEIDSLCSSIGLLHKGRLLDAGPTRSLLSRFSGAGVRVIIGAPGKLKAVAAWLRDCPGVDPEQIRLLREGAVEISLNENVTNRADLFMYLGEARIGVTSMQTLETSVEDVLISLVGNSPSL